MTLPIRRLSRALAIPALAYVPVLLVFGLQLRQTVRTADRQVGITIRSLDVAYWVDEVAAGGRASAAGVAAGDVVLEVGGVPVADLGQPRPEVLFGRLAVPTPLLIYRDGEEISLIWDPTAAESERWSARAGLAGIRISAVAERGAAAEAGLRPGDHLLEVDGVRVTSSEDYDPVAHDFRRERAVKFRFQRGLEIQELEVLPGGMIPFGVVALNTFMIFLCLAMGLVSLAKRPASLPASLLWQLSVLVALEIALPMNTIGAPTLDFLTTIIYLLLTGAQLGTMFHLASVIPERRSWLVQRPWIVPAYYVVAGIFAVNAAATYVVEWSGFGGILPWSAAGAQAFLIDRVLLFWAIGLMLILFGPSISYPTRRGRRQARFVMAGLAPWSMYILTLSVAEVFGISGPAWLDSFWSLVMLPFPIAIFLVLLDAIRVRRGILIDLIERVQDAGSLEGIEALVRRDLDLAFHVKHSFVFLRDKQSSQLTTTHVGPEGRTEVERIPDGYVVLKALEKAGRALAYPEDFEDELPHEERRWLDRLQASLVVPLVGAHHRLTGLLVLADKTSEEPFTPDDLQLLRALSGQIALACENMGLQIEVEEKEREQQEMLERLQGENLHLVKVCPRCRSCFGSELKICPLDGVKLVIPHPVERVVRERYRLEGELGKGGLATVFEAWDLHLERSVAVKVLTRSLVESPDSLRRFQREARLAARLVHPAIVTVHDFGKTETGSPYLVMERVVGSTLGQILEREGSLAPQRAADWFDQMLGGLAAAHRAGVVHRDLKPDNVMISRDGDRAVVKIVDFGLAKIREESGMSATAPGMILGTLSYMSPEQLRGVDVDTRADIFAVGVMVVESITGRRPFSGKDPAQVLTSILQDPFDLPGLDPATRRLREILGRCLDKDKEARWANVDDLRRELIPGLRDLPSVASQSSSGGVRPATEIIELRDIVEPHDDVA